jgi:hypothetical protein
MTDISGFGEADDVRSQESALVENGGVVAVPGASFITMRQRTSAIALPFRPPSEIIREAVKRLRSRAAARR